MNAKFELNGKTIETERLILRPFCLGDIEDFYEYASVDGVGEMAGWKHHASKEESKDRLEIFIKEDKTFAIIYKENKKVIGSVGIELYNVEDNFKELDDYIGRSIGFVLAKPYWGKGLIVEAVTAVINYLFNELNYDFLLCGHFDFNGRSKRVQEKLGFKPYRKTKINTQIYTEEPGTMNLLVNPNKDIKLNFSHPETLIYK